MRTIPKALAGLGVSGLLAIGCASGGAAPVSDAQAKIDRERQRVAELERELSKTRGDLQLLERQLSAVSSPPPVRSAGDELFPPNAKPGECYARAFVPPTYRTTTIQKLKKAASERVEVEPARYEYVEERVLVKEASERLEVIPATYEWAEERVLVKEASTRLVEVPAEYGYEEERVLVKPAQTVWKKGRGPIERMDEGTGEIMCLVEIPAEYRTVRTRVLKRPATTKEVPIPAEYQTVRKRVLARPATTRTITIPAEYETVKVRRLAKPPTERRIEVPAEYQTVSQRERVTEGRMEWRPVLCETNATRATVASIQRALEKAGYSPGPIDGVIGSRTLAAVRSYQVKQGLPQGGLNYRTIDALGVKVGR